MSDKYLGAWNKTKHRLEPEVDGERHTLHEWSQITGVSVELMIWRLNKGWDWEDAIFKTPRKYKDNIEKRRQKLV